MRDASPWMYVVSGALAMGDAIAALFFARFRRQTGSRLFTWFAAWMIRFSPIYIAT